MASAMGRSFSQTDIDIVGFLSPAFPPGERLPEACPSGHFRLITWSGGGVWLRRAGSLVTPPYTGRATRADKDAEHANTAPALRDQPLAARASWGEPNQANVKEGAWSSGGRIVKVPPLASSI